MNDSKDEEATEEVTGYDADGKPVYGNREIKVGDDAQGGDQR
jgi:hypothetical protein